MLKKILKTGAALMLGAGMALSGCQPGGQDVDEITTESQESDEPIPTGSGGHDPTDDDFTTDSGGDMFCTGEEGQRYSSEEGKCVDDPCLPDDPCTAPNTVCQFDDAQPGNYRCECGSGFAKTEPGDCVAIPGSGCDDAITLEGSEGDVEIPVANYPNGIEGPCSGTGPQVVYTLSVAARSLFVAKLSVPGACGWPGNLAVQTECDNPESSLACGVRDEDFYTFAIPIGDTDYTTAGTDGNDTNTTGTGDTSSEECKIRETILSVALAPGPFTLVVESSELLHRAGRLSYALVEDPCAAVLCGDGTECVPSHDWTNYECRCADGYIKYEGACIADPCSPNPCNDPFGDICAAQLPTEFTCACWPGFNPSESGCHVDPTARGESCGDVVPAIDEETAASLNGELTFEAGDFANNAQGSCGGSGPEKVLALHVAKPSYLFASGNGGFPVLYLRSACEQASTELSCVFWDAVEGGETDTDAPFSGLDLIVEPGEYSLFLDNDHTQGTFNYYWSLSPL